MNQQLRVRDFMDRSFVRLHPETDVYRAIDILLSNGLTGAPVVDAKDEPVGILSERDCMRTLLQGAYNSLPMGRVGDYMSREVRSVTPETDIFEVADYFTKNHYRRLLVVEGKRLVGQITRRDVLRAAFAVQSERTS